MKKNANTNLICKKNIKRDVIGQNNQNAQSIEIDVKETTNENSFDMNKIVGSHHILFLCLDSLRYDVAYEEQQSGGTPVLNRYGTWRKCQAPGNFTYPSHQAMFTGFFPIDENITNMKNREKLFFAPDIGMGRKVPSNTYQFSGATWVEGLEKVGYETYCIGGLSFFDKRTDIGKVMPGYFKHSYWKPSFGCKVEDSTEHQIAFALNLLADSPACHTHHNGNLYTNQNGSHRDNIFENYDDSHNIISLDRQNAYDSHNITSLDCQNATGKIMMYINISALHYPCHFYLPDATEDSKETQAAALRYVDKCLEPLFDKFSSMGDTFVICCSDHGTCFGEDGIWYHGINHPNVTTVPYKHFTL